MKTKLLAKNRKIAKSKVNTFNFGIPAYQSITGLITCPGAKDCIKGCYARQGAYAWSPVKQAYENRLQATLSDNFPIDLWEAIVENKAERIRIHDSGDFYSYEYLCKWLLIAESLPHVEFYCYTKRVDLFKEYRITPPKNFTVIFSYGGKFDHLIEPNTDKHSVVFSNENDLLSSGYLDASDNDDTIFLLNTTKETGIGLIYHGASSKDWGLRQ